jgi:N-acetylmuramoyl-L-alanine amidase
MTRNPAQFVLDIPNASLARKFDDITESGALINGIRAEQMQGAVRLTVDLSGLAISNVRQYDAPSRIVIDLDLPRGSGGSLAGKVIMIDPGHGGQYPGARACSGTCEKDYTLQVATRLQKALSDEGACALMTRQSDVALDPDLGRDLEKRVELAARQSAQIFVSIHCNSCAVRGSRSGTETYYHFTAKVLADCIHSEVVKVNELPDCSVRADSRLYKSGLAVLRNSAHSGITAVLVETAFIDNPGDENKVKNPDWQTNMAEAIARGIKIYVKGSPRGSGMQQVGISPKGDRPEADLNRNQANETAEQGNSIQRTDTQSSDGPHRPGER